MTLGMFVTSAINVSCADQFSPKMFMFDGEVQDDGNICKRAFNSAPARQSTQVCLARKNRGVGPVSGANLSEDTAHMKLYCDFG